MTSIARVAIERSILLPLCAGNLHEWFAKACAQQNLVNIKKNLGNQGLTRCFSIGVFQPLVSSGYEQQYLHFEI